jgi:hypothetical protein
MRRIDAGALALELVEAVLQLTRHRVELLAEGGELVVADRLHGRGEVAAAQPPGGVEET